MMNTCMHTFCRGSIIQPEGGALILMVRLAWQSYRMPS